MKEGAVFRFGKYFHSACVGPIVKECGYFLDDKQTLVGCKSTVVHPTPGIVFVSDRPLVKVVPNFLTKEECAHLRDLARPRLTPSEVGVANDDQSPGEMHGERITGRTSSSAFFDSKMDDIVIAVEERAAALAGFPNNRVGRLHVGHYFEGQRFAIHWDAHGSKDAAALLSGYQRLQTVLVYLNTPVCKPDCTKGGSHTEFPLLGVSVPPEEGKAVQFQNVGDDGELFPEALHSGNPVCCDEKWVVNVWLYNKDLIHGQVPLHTPVYEK
eukprot:NODE_793_length_1339_cov_223.660465_g601_i0.p1 GENE.NODE_793_length_1339_cov_223.660465_g601_i0~~NODE_793_length_1339_cov_223.660465_g601_i0.p1  ORF type:complete len:269 (-),score=60.76 NODE_793_length_1339_cov_223.660465_g601_i0:137-943(-)